MPMSKAVKDRRRILCVYRYGGNGFWILFVNKRRIFGSFLGHIPLAQSTFSSTMMTFPSVDYCAMQLLVLSILINIFYPVASLDDGLSLTPPMGWLSWERFGCQTNCSQYPDTCISETLYLPQAHLLVAGGYRDAGYQYVNTNDRWSEMHRVNGKIVEDRSRFPRGLKYLSRTFERFIL